MGWFDEQIKQRIQMDDDTFYESFDSMAQVIMGKNAKIPLLSDRQKIKSAVDEILSFYHVKSSDFPEELDTLDEQLEYLLRPSGVMRRNVSLKGKWYINAIGPFLGKLKNGGVVALLPHKISGYTFFDFESGKTIKVNKQTALLLENEAICFYKPLPLKKLGMHDLLVFILGFLSPTDITLAAATAFGVTLIAMLYPFLNNLLFSNVLETGNMQLFLAIAVMTVSTIFAEILIQTVHHILLGSIQTKLSVSVQAAAMMRVISLPAIFFRNYSAGELTNRTQNINNLCQTLCDVFLTTGLVSLFSLVYITQIFHYSPSLMVPALIITLITASFTALTAYIQMKISKNIMEISAKESGIIYSFITGVQKLKLAGAEKRAFSRWATLYQKKAKLIYDPPVFLKLNNVISLAISLIGAIVLYFIAIKTNVSIADYFSFNVAFGMVSGAFSSLSGIALTVATIKPTFEMIKPILEAVPEIDKNKKVLTRINGGIELSRISFRYSESMPLILDNLSLKISPGQYVALVGKTGCGKSTLIRLLLGFETPQKGGIYYDGKDIRNVDLKSLRRRIGVVSQNSKLISGDIFSNITISAPWLTLEQAWEAARMAGISEDIKKMPMGMSTFISEGNGGISGGQRQRLMIARAIAANPKILMFDEATSALDNFAQKTIVESLDSLKCTRIVIAHRLSTIRQCDRIIVLNEGKIIEDGSYNELIQKNGYFAELVSRQRIDNSQTAEKTKLS